MRYLKTVLEELDIRYSMPIQPVVLPPGQSYGYGAVGPTIQIPRPGRRPTDGSGYSEQAEISHNIFTYLYI
jgi:hypothetical protein